MLDALFLRTAIEDDLVADRLHWLGAKRFGNLGDHTFGSDVGGLQNAYLHKFVVFKRGAYLLHYAFGQRGCYRNGYRAWRVNFQRVRSWKLYN